MLRLFICLSAERSPCMILMESVKIGEGVSAVCEAEAALCKQTQTKAFVLKASFCPKYMTCVDRNVQKWKQRIGLFCVIESRDVKDRYRIVDSINWKPDMNIFMLVKKYKINHEVNNLFLANSFACCFIYLFIFYCLCLFLYMWRKQKGSKSQACFYQIGQFLSAKVNHSECCVHKTLEKLVFSSNNTWLKGHNILGYKNKMYSIEQSKRHTQKNKVFFPFVDW